MEQLIKKIAADAGITEQQAASAIQGVLGALKEKLPSFMHTYLDRAANGEHLSDSIREEANEAISTFAKKSEEIIDSIKEKISGFTKK